ncbi:MAG: SGNH/GDSL hydrolase family protein [Henriciella sp.]
MMFSPIRPLLLIGVSAFFFAACSSIPQAVETQEEHLATAATISAEQRWDAMVAENFRRRPRILSNPGVDYWEAKDELPNVLIYGDSISIAYTQQVRSELSGMANVLRLPANGSHSGDIIEKLKDMHAGMKDPTLSDPWDFEWDIIYFNAGLHDLKYVASGKLDKENGELVNTPDAYKRNLRAAIAYMREIAPNAQLIFATTTPVPEGEPGRFVLDVPVYNEAAISVVGTAGIPVHDLYAFTLPSLDEWIIGPGNVHYKEYAAKAQGTEVANYIKRFLE